MQNNRIGDFIVQSSQDIEHIRLLSIFHYIVAGILALFSMFPLVHLAIGIAVVTGAFENVDSGEPPPRFLGWFLIAIALFIIALGLTMAVCVAIAGRRLARHTSRLFCLVVAGLECMFAPFGTVLGVFTLIVLLRPSVKELFETEPLAATERT